MWVWVCEGECGSECEGDRECVCLQIIYKEPTSNNYTVKKIIVDNLEQ